MLSRLYLLPICLLILMAGCATPYQPYGVRGGYSNVQLDSNTAQVSFEGNGFTGKNTVKTYLLYRCAELTVLNGYDYFVIVEGGTGTQQSSYTTPGTYSGTTNVFGNTAYSSGTYTPGATIPIIHHSGSYTIKLFKGQKPELPRAFQAKELMRYLRSQFSELAEAEASKPEDGAVTGSVRPPDSELDAGKQKARAIAVPITVNPVLMPPLISASVRRLAVVPLSDPRGHPRVTSWLDLTLNFLRSRHPQLILVERETLRPLLDEILIQQSGRVDHEQSVRIGKHEGVPLLVEN